MALGLEHIYHAIWSVTKMKSGAPTADSLAKDSCTQSSVVRSHGMRYPLDLNRHGESQWNLENRFTGWYNIQLSPKGEEEAAEGGRLLNEAGYKFGESFLPVPCDNDLLFFSR